MSMSDNSRLSVLVRGRVQGVFFRYFVQEAAAVRGITGYAYNRADGRSVEVVAEGPKAQLEGLLEQLHIGPRDAVVEDVEVTWSVAEGRFEGFRVG